MANVVPVKGLRELQQKMRGLPGKIRDRALLNSLFTAAEPMRDEARRLAAKETGKLARNIVLARGKATGYEHDAEVVLTVRSRGKKDDPNNAFYWKFIELGHFVRVAKALREGAAQAVKFIAARPFMRPAFETHKEGAVERFRVSLAKRIEDLVGKYLPTAVRQTRGR